MLQAQHSKMKTAALVDRIGNPFAKKTKNKLTAAATLVDMSKKVTEAAAALTNLAGKDGVALQYGGDKLGALSNVLKASRLVAALRSNGLAQTFIKNPGDDDAAAAWARDAANTFGVAADLIPGSTNEPGVPIAIPLAIFKGLLKAPANYVNAFLTILDAHKAELDSAASLSKLNPKYYDGSVLAENLRWGGPLTNAYATAPRALQDHMTGARQRVKDGKSVDLWSASAAVGRALVVTDIEDKAPERDRPVWVRHVQTH